MNPFKEKLPEQFEFVSLRPLTEAGTEKAFRAAVRRWNGRERLKRGFSRSFKILFPIMLAILPLGILDPFAFMVWGGVVYGVLFLVAGPLLFSKYFNEDCSLLYVEGVCPQCRGSDRLNPYVNTQLSEKLVVLCPSCGDTTTLFYEA